MTVVECGSLAEAGLKILDRTRLLVRDIRDLRASVADGAPAGELRLGASTSALTGLLPPLLHRLYRKYPSLTVFAEPGTSSHLYHQVISGTLDASIIVQPQERLEIDALPSIASIVAAGLGVSLIPDWAPKDLGHLPLLRVPLPGPAPVRRMGLLFALNSAHTSLVRALLRAVDDGAPTSGQCQYP